MKRTVLSVCFLALILSLFSGCVVFVDQPDYMHPYGEGVDPDSVSTKPYQTTSTTKYTTTVTTSTTTTATTSDKTTTTTRLSDADVPQGCVICPGCEGVKLVCEVCYGTDQCKVEIYDPDTGVYVRKFQNCQYCSEQDPGFYFCEICQNQLYIEE